MAKHCLSCGMPLDGKMENMKNLKNNDFCVFCADENGKLKSYRESVIGIASWLGSFDKTGNNINYIEKAVEYLKAMPAWAEHEAEDITGMDKTSLIKFDIPDSCQSCGVPFSPETKNTEMYCSFCSRENGELKKRNEITDAFEMWLREISPEKEGVDFRKRAEHYLNAMPAWG